MHNVYMLPSHLPMRDSQQGTILLQVKKDYVTNNSVKKVMQLDGQ